MEPLTISGQGLKVDDVVAVANGRPVALDPAALPAIERSQACKWLSRAVTEGRAERHGRPARYRLLGHG